MSVGLRSTNKGLPWLLRAGILSSGCRALDRAPMKRMNSWSFGRKVCLQGLYMYTELDQWSGVLRGIEDSKLSRRCGILKLPSEERFAGANSFSLLCGSSHVSNSISFRVDAEGGPVRRCNATLGESK